MGGKIAGQGRELDRLATLKVHVSIRQSINQSSSKTWRESTTNDEPRISVTDDEKIP